MPNRNYQRGRSREYRVIKSLQDEGYTCIRAAGSKGMFDIVAVGPKGIRLIQVKLNKGPTSGERSALAEFRNHPANAVKEVWMFTDGSREPVVQQIQ